MIGCVAQMSLEVYLRVIGCGSGEGGVWKGDVGIVWQAVDRKKAVLHDRHKTMHPLQTISLLTATYAKLLISY